MPAAAGPLVTLEVLIVEHIAANDGEKRAETPTAARFVELYKQGKLDRVLRVQMSAVDQNPSLVQLGERVPVATGRASRGGFGGRGRLGFG